MKALLMFVLLAFSASAQTGQQDRDVARVSGRIRRLALAIGNDAYPGNPLHNAVNDARSMKSALEDVGFTVQLSLNATQQQMETVIDEFTGGVHPGDIALFFYAGHGVQISDQNYLVPVDFQARTAVDAKYKAYPAQRVQENLEVAGASLQILVLDACRDNPFRGWRGGSVGLAAMQAGKGTYIAFATSPGKTAADNPGGRNGLFTGELITVLREAGLSIDQVFNRVREKVAAKSHGEQLPWSTSSVTGEFYFKATIEGSVSIPTPPRDLSGERELAFWNSIKDENDPALLEEYMRRYPAGEFSSIAKSKLMRLKTAAEPPPAVASLPRPVGSQVYSPTDSRTELVKRKAEELTFATVAGNFAVVIDMTYPKILELMGGREKAISLVETQMKAMKEQGATILDFKLGVPSEFKTGGSDLFTVIPTTVIVKIPAGKLTGKSFLVGISSDQGKTWSFADGAQMTEESIKTLFTKFPPSLKLPDKTPPVIEKTP
jgi:Caspase domain